MNRYRYEYSKGIYSVQRPHKINQCNTVTIIAINSYH